MVDRFNFLISQNKIFTFIFKLLCYLGLLQDRIVFLVIIQLIANYVVLKLIQTSIYEIVKFPLQQYKTGYLRSWMNNIVSFTDPLFFRKRLVLVIITFVLTQSVVNDSGNIRRLRKVCFSAFLLSTRDGKFITIIFPFDVWNAIILLFEDWRWKAVMRQLSYNPEAEHARQLS